MSLQNRLKPAQPLGFWPCDRTQEAAGSSLASSIATESRANLRGIELAPAAGRVFVGDGGGDVPLEVAGSAFAEVDFQVVFVEVATAVMKPAPWASMTWVVLPSRSS